MRTLHLLAPLAALLLCACDPGGGNNDAGSSLPRERRGDNIGNLTPDTADHRQLDAQDSIGKAPQPRDMIANVADVCPVHREKMSIRTIPIVFDDGEAGSESGGLTATAQFPFGAE